MSQQSVEKISKIILSFKNLNEPWKFEAFVLQNELDERDLIKFKEIWAKAIEFENWNYSDLKIGKNKTIEVLKRKFNLEESIATKIADAASYQWK